MTLRQRPLGQLLAAVLFVTIRAPANWLPLIMARCCTAWIVLRVTTRSVVKHDCIRHETPISAVAWHIPDRELAGIHAAIEESLQQAGPDQRAAAC